MWHHYNVILENSDNTKRPWQRLAISNNWNHLSAYVIWNILVLNIKGKVNKIAITHTIFCYKECRCLVAGWWFSPYIAVSYSCVQMTKDGTDNYILVQSWLLFHYYVIRWPCILSTEPLNRNESGRFGALKSDSTHHFFRNACTKSGSLRFSQFSGCWLILSVYIIKSFDFPFVRLFGVR
jgi:hypothetical protein